MVELVNLGTRNPILGVGPGIFAFFDDPPPLLSVKMQQSSLLAIHSHHVFSDMKAGSYNPLFISIF